ncbi:MAG: 23S rRNA (pseudouridine(1915)-N(3))-methyltransferase RlmH [Lachnospiraceae bacterium]|nr:23S rRNA (pseudouridine(1915)-N(3))-methyltransferase RlmH [Lachnospiraceae bacterium]
MKITILCVGRIKEKFYSEAVNEYVKRLGRYCRPEIIETADEKTPDEASEKENRMIKEKEGGRILKELPADSYVIALDIKGKKASSEQLASNLEGLFINGRSHICFIIGGSLGLSDEVLQKADERLSFSDMTFPHQLMRVILLEQIYRAFKIIRKEPYHK